MRIRKLVLSFIIFILFISPTFAEASFYQTVINASYLSDFAYNAFPLSIWADFGVSGINLMEDLSTKLYVRVEAGITQRTLKQYPNSGDLIDIEQYPDSLSYSVAFSDGSAVFEQGVLTDPDRPGHDMISITVSLRMRWEQAFATFADIRNGDYGGIFDYNDLFDKNNKVSYVGAPELSGNKYFLSNSFSFSASLNRMYSDYMEPHGYYVDVGMVFAPFWLGNTVDFISEYISTDAYRFRISGEYDYTILNKKSHSGKNLYSLYVKASSSATFLFGDSIPRYLQDGGFMGKSIAPRLFYGDIWARLQFNGPELLTLGTYPAAYIFVRNGINAGPLINSNKSNTKVEFLGGFGMGLQITFIGYLRAFIEYSYIYTPIFGEKTGNNFNVGCYLTMLF